MTNVKDSREKEEHLDGARVSDGGPLLGPLAFLNFLKALVHAGPSRRSGAAPPAPPA